jgi:L-histidine Nalpha-methyltransferase
LPRMSQSPLRQPQFIQLLREDLVATRRELGANLLAPSAHISPKYLYDTLGSRLFDAITELPEYYPTRTEAALLAEHAPAMAALLPHGATLVDLGAGNCEKAAHLFGWLQPVRYVAVDISVEFLRDAMQKLQQNHPALDMLGVGMDFSSLLVLPPEVGTGTRVLFYPGSSIGNFSPVDAVRFLRQARAAATGGGLLIGVDMVKSLEILQPAYDDALGVTAAFNKNLLLHLNRLIGSDFAVRDWAHVAFFNADESRIEMHLQAMRDVSVRWPGAERHFAKGERIHTENSYKYETAAFERLLREAGFKSTRVWHDAKAWFAMFWASD